MLADAFDHVGLRLPTLRQRAFTAEWTHLSRGATSQTCGLSAHVHALAQGATLPREIQGPSACRLPGSDEHPRHHAPVWGLLPDRHGLGGGGKIRGLPAFPETLLPSQNGDVLELDELWSFVGKKTQECWLWLALCRRTRQIVAYTIGDRDKEGALSLREHLPTGYRRRATRSDFWLAYEAASPRRTHCFGGKEEDETNHAERWFGTVRARLSRLVRQTYSFSKSVERHLEAIHLFITG